MLHQVLTNKIIKAYYTVYNKLGYGFLERVYENAMLLELQTAQLSVTHQMPIDVFYKGHRVGLYFADLCVEHSVIIELKAAEGIAPEHEHQLLNYLKATDIELGLLFNFGLKPEFRRKIFENNFKHPSSSF